MTDATVEPAVTALAFKRGALVVTNRPITKGMLLGTSETERMLPANEEGTVVSVVASYDGVLALSPYRVDFGEDLGGWWVSADWLDAAVPDVPAERTAPDAIDEATTRIELKPADGADGICAYLYDKDGYAGGGYGETLADALSVLARMLGSDPSPVTVMVQADPDEPVSSRKLAIDTSVYCTATTKFTGGRAGCDHDYDPKPTFEGNTYAEWRCTLCGGIVTVEVWE